MINRKQQRSSWRPFIIYTVLLVVAVISIYPLQLEAIRNLSLQTEAELPFSVEVMGLISLLQPLFLSLAALLVGHKLAKKVGLDSLLYANMNRQVISPVKKSAKPFLLAAACGLILGVLFVGFDVLLRPWLEFLGEVRPSVAGLVVGILYGGIVEEVLLRWGLMTIFVYALTKKGTQRRPGAYILAIFLAALLFALGHYGATQAMTEMTALVWIRMLLLNGMGGVVFGWLYWKYHLEAAIVAHMFAHVGMFVTNLLLFWIGI